MKKVGGNLRAQEAAFQAAEKALRFCERNIVLAAGDRNMCNMRAGSTITVYEPEEPENIKVERMEESFPKRWTKIANWTGPSKIATAVSGVDTMAGVASQPQCMIERWWVKGRDARYYPYVITARGVGTTSTSVVYLQEVIRCGNY